MGLPVQFKSSLRDELELYCKNKPSTVEILVEKWIRQFFAPHGLAKRMKSDKILYQAMQKNLPDIKTNELTTVNIDKKLAKQFLIYCSSMDFDSGNLLTLILESVIKNFIRKVNKPDTRRRMNKGLGGGPKF